MYIYIHICIYIYIYVYIYICIYMCVCVCVCVRVCVCVCVCVCRMHTHAYKYIYPVIATRSYTYTRGHPRMRVPTRLRTHTRTCASAAPPGRNAGAYRVQRGDTRGVPRADVRVERRRIGERLRAEPPAVDADGRALASVGADACAPNRTRRHMRAHAHRRSTSACVYAAGLHRRSVHRCSQTRVDIDACMHHVYITHCVCACSIDGRPYEVSASHSHTCRV